MPATQRTKITRKDIHKAESLPTLIGEMVKRIKEANDEVKEHAATALQSIAQMDHGEHADTLYKAGAVKPLQPYGHGTYAEEATLCEPQPAAFTAAHGEGESNVVGEDEVPLLLVPDQRDDGGELELR